MRMPQAYLGSKENKEISMKAIIRLTIFTLQQHISNIDEVNEVESASEATLEDNVPPLFSASDLVVFRGTPGMPFEFSEVMDDAHQDNVKGTTKIVGNFLILQYCNEFRALFFKDHNGSKVI